MVNLIEELTSQKAALARCAKKRSLTKFPPHVGPPSPDEDEFDVVLRGRCPSAR